MNASESERESRLMALLDEALAELRSGHALDIPSWQARHPELADELPDLLETLRDLDSSAQTWKTGTGLTLDGQPATAAEMAGGAALAAPQPAQVGRHRILEWIGGGGMGTVYKAYDPVLERVVALKIPRLDRLGYEGDAVRQRFLREARAAARVRHAHVCPIHDVGAQDGVPFVVMAYVAGQSLAEKLKRQGHFSDLAEAVALVRQVAEGLAAVHADGIVHRDLKPGNILLDETGQALLADFGLALPESNAEPLTADGVIVGTVTYMAPEQAAGSGARFGPAADLYSLGVVLYQMLTGRTPFEGPPLGQLARIAREVPPPPSQFRCDLDPALEAVVLKAMARRPEERYASAQEFAVALQQWRAGATATRELPRPDSSAAAGPEPATVVQVQLPDGSPVTVRVDHPAARAGRLAVKVCEEKASRGKRKRRRLVLSVSLTLAVLLLVVSLPLLHFGQITQVKYSGSGMSVPASYHAPAIPDQVAAINREPFEESLDLARKALARADYEKSLEHFRGATVALAAGPQSTAAEARLEDLLREFDRAAATAPSSSFKDRVVAMRMLVVAAQPAPLPQSADPPPVAAQASPTPAPPEPKGGAKGTQPLAPNTARPDQPVFVGSGADRDLLEKVARRLYAVIDPLPNFVLPPIFEVARDDRINAYATARLEGQGKAAKVRPRVVVFSGMLDRVIRNKDDADGDADRLAFTLSHELGHVILAHIVRPPAGETGFVQIAFGRQQEIDADLKGAALALKAGFSFRRGRSVIDRVRQLGLNYSSFEGLGQNHPSWSDRLIFLDREQATLWKAMSAFENGVLFLHFEQYASAERCFREVVKEFPDCYEAWTNLGDALLMQYCDGLDLDDLRKLNVGQIAVAGFYQRPASLEALVRGMDEKLWKEAVEALEKALKLKPGLTLAKANLGVAYLVSPYGKDVRKATSYLQEAADQAEADPALSPLARVAVFLNAGVADLAAGKGASSEQKILKAAEIGRRSADKLPRTPVSASLFCALLYNRALSLSLAPENAKRRGAVEVFEQYLMTASPASTWWTLAYERYGKLCKDLGLPAKAKDQLAHADQAAFRPLTSVKLASGVTVTLSEPVKDAVSRLGEGQAIPVVRGTKLVRWRYPEQGIDLLGADRVLAITLRGPKAPPLPLQAFGPGGAVKQLRLGMKQQELEEVLKDEVYDVRQFDQADVGYRFYPGLGLAVRLHKEKVEEMVVALIPRRSVARGE